MVCAAAQGLLLVAASFFYKLLADLFELNAPLIWRLKGLTLAALGTIGKL